MKKWMIYAAIGLAAAGITSCKPAGSQATQGAESSVSTEAESPQDGAKESQGESSEGEASQEMPNPYEEVDGPEGLKEAGLSMEAPEGAEDAAYYIISQEIGEITFTLEDAPYSYRGAVHAQDFAGIFEEFEEDVSALSDCGADEDLIVKTTVSGGRLANWSKNGAKYTLYTPRPVEDEDMFALCIELIGKN